MTGSTPSLLKRGRLFECAEPVDIVRRDPAGRELTGPIVIRADGS